MSNLELYVYYIHRQQEYKHRVDSFKDAFEWADDMENGYTGGYAYAVGTMVNKFYTRVIDHENGSAHWRNGLTGDTFDEYRE